jgi:ADP-ribose diphosphatase
MTDPVESGLQSSQLLYDGRVIKLSLDRVVLPNGNEANLEVIRHPGAAVALPLETGPSGKPIAVLVRQYRYASDGYLLEVPGGKLDGPEDPEVCVRRELEEEIGYTPGSLEPLGWIWTTPGFTDEKIWLYVARDIVEIEGGSRLEDDEVLEIERIPLREAVAMASSGEITDAKTVATLLRASLRLGL